MDNRGIDTDPGWINRQLRELRLAIEAVRSERRAASTEVTTGDFIVSGGGSVKVKGGGGVSVENGGAVTVRDGGGLKTLHSNGTQALYMGSYLVGANTNQGLILRDPATLPILSGEYDTVTGERRVRLGNTTPAGARLASLVTAAVDSVFYGPNDNVYIYMDPGGDISLSPDTAAGKSVIIKHTTTANAANTYMDALGRVYRSTSSRRYKQDEQPANIDTAAVLALQPRVFRTKAEVAEDGDDAPTHAGFIAEEAADLGLEHWVTRDQDGEPESFSYAQFCVAQQAVIQQQANTIADLSKRVARLEAATPPTTPTA